MRMKKTCGNNTGELAVKLYQCSKPFSKRLYAMERRATIGGCFFSFICISACPRLWEHADSTTKKMCRPHFYKQKHSAILQQLVIVYRHDWNVFCKYNLPYDKVRIDFCRKKFSTITGIPPAMECLADGNNFHSIITTVMLYNLTCNVL